MCSVPIVIREWGARATSECGTPYIEAVATIQPQWAGHAVLKAVHPNRAKTQCRNTYAPKSRGRKGMEAQGIEPWSEPASSTASTCVGRCLRVVPGRSSANLPETNLRRISPATSEDHGRPARFCYSTPTPRTGSVAEGAGSELSSASYAASAKSELAVEFFPSGFTRNLDLGTLPHLLLTRRNQSPPSIGNREES